MPSVKVCVRDTLFGGLRTPELGVASISLQEIASAHKADERGGSAASSDDEEGSRSVSTSVSLGGRTTEVGGGVGGHATPRRPSAPAPNLVTVRTWENERWYPAEGWCARMLPSDPPQWSSQHAPFEELPRDDGIDAFPLPSKEWEWTGEWQVERPPDADADGYVYAVCHHGTSADPFGACDLGDCVRRRCWARSRSRRPPEDLSTGREERASSDAASTDESDADSEAESEVPSAPSASASPFSLFASGRFPDEVVSSTADIETGADPNADHGGESEGGAMTVGLSDAERQVTGRRSREAFPTPPLLLSPPPLPTSLPQPWLPLAPIPVAAALPPNGHDLPRSPL